jgi:hypothetical protein
MFAPLNSYFLSNCNQEKPDLGAGRNTYIHGWGWLDFLARWDMLQ